MKTAIIIPAREKSTRFPNKPMANINGKTMVNRVWEQAIKSGVGDVYVSTDSEEITKHCQSFGAKVLITSSELSTGTDRVAAATKQLTVPYDYIINLQGDLPFIDSKLVLECLTPLKEGYDIGTLVTPLDETEISNPNTVKCLVSYCKTKMTGRAHWFIRAAVPGYQHLGIYAFKLSTLMKIYDLEQSFFEKEYSLEQMRFLENDLRVGVKLINPQPPEVNTPEDLIKAIEYAKKTDKKGILDFWPFSHI